MPKPVPTMLRMNAMTKPMGDPMIQPIQPPAVAPANESIAANDILMGYGLWEYGSKGVWGWEYGDGSIHIPIFTYSHSPYSHSPYSHSPIAHNFHLWRNQKKPR